MKKRTFFRVALWTIGGIVTFVAVRKLIVKNVIGKNIHGTIGIKEKKEDDNKKS